MKNWGREGFFTLISGAQYSLSSTFIGVIIDTIITS